MTILKQCMDVYLPFLTINHTITEIIFPKQLKKLEVVSLYKKEDPLKKENYRPVRLLPHVSKVLRGWSINKLIFTCNIKYQNT